MSDDEFDVEMGQLGDKNSRRSRKPGTLVGKVLTSSRRAGATAVLRQGPQSRGTGRHGRGRTATLRAKVMSRQRRVVIKARIVRHSGTRFRSAPLVRHITYLERDGVTRDKQRGKLFDADGDEADGDAFARGCTDDRHHFRFIVSPEDATELADLRTFTRELMEDVASDLNTPIEWVAADHWNTDNPHVHVLVRGKAADGTDLVIDRDYIRDTMRSRAEERATIELGPRSEHDIQRSLIREISADRWTSLDRHLLSARTQDQLIDLRPSSDQERKLHACLVGRIRHLSQMGLAAELLPGRWTMRSDAEQVLRDLGMRGDIIKSVHRAMSGQGWAVDLSRLAIHEQAPAEQVVGRLVARGFQDELSGTAYAVVEGVDGRIHHLGFSSIEATGETPPGGIVELRQSAERSGVSGRSLRGLCNLGLADQVTARGATWLDQQLLAKDPAALGAGFGRDVAEALDARRDQLMGQGLVSSKGGATQIPGNLLETLHQRELADAAGSIAESTGLELLPSKQGDHVAGIYRHRIDLTSGRFAMVDNGLGFQLVPWLPSMERKLGQSISGIVNERGGVDWSFTRSRSLGL